MSTVYTCKPCKETFRYRCRYLKHLQSRSHINFVGYLSTLGASHTEEFESHEESERQYEDDPRENDPCEDDPCALGDDTAEYESDTYLEEEFLDTDMDVNATDDTYYPFPSKIFSLLYMLVKGTQQVSEQTLAFVWFILQEMGVKTPSLAAVKSFKLPGTQPTVRHVNKDGIPFYTIPLAVSIQQYLGRSDIAEALVRFPVHAQDRSTEMFHGKRWCTDKRYSTPMVVSNYGTHIFVRDCILFHHPLTGMTKGMVVNFFQQDHSREVFVELDMLLNLEQFKCFVPETEAVYVDSSSCILFDTTVELSISHIFGHADPPNCIAKWMPPSHFHRLDLQETVEYLAPHPLKVKADGKPIVMLPLVLFADDTSGNRSKKWHKFESWYFKLAGLPHGIGTRLENMHFVCSSDRVSALEMAEPIAEELIKLEKEGIEVYDAYFNTVVLVIAPVICIVADNPMASVLLNHLHGRANKYCRFCMVDRNEDPTIVCSKRTREAALQQMAEISSLRTEQAKTERRTHYGVHENSNPLLLLPADPYKCLPLEALHTLPLGPAKHLLREQMPLLSKVQKAEILARLKAFHTSGFSVKLYGNVCYYYQSFCGRDFKAWVQMALFIIGPYLGDGELAVWKSFCKVFQIAYCKFFAPSLSDEWRALCQTFVNTVKQHMPHLLQKQKVHLILHMVECMEEFGPTCAFNAERFELFNSRVRAYNVFSNRLSSSRDIAQHFAAIQHLRYICQAREKERCSLGLQRLFSSTFVQHTLCGISYKELYSDKDIYQPGTPRKVSTCTTLLALPLCVSLRSQTTDLETLQRCEPSYDIHLSDVCTTDVVVRYKAVISQECCLINCGDYIELYSNDQQYTFGLLMAVFKTPSGATLCLLQGFQPLCSANGDQRHNMYDCPLLELTRSIFTVHSEYVRRSVNMVHQCTQSCTFQESLSAETCERETVVSNKLTFVHDLRNTSYCFNVYCIL